MDCLCNQTSPRSTSTKFILKPTSKTFISGLAKSYEVKYYPDLKQYIEEKDLCAAIEHLNYVLESKWPCCFCFTFGFLFSFVSAGLSFFCPYVCIKEAYDEMQMEIDNLNANLFNPCKLKLTYKSNCLTSWLQIDIIDYSTLNSTGVTPKEKEMVSIDNNDSHNKDDS